MPMELVRPGPLNLAPLCRPTLTRADYLRRLASQVVCQNPVELYLKTLTSLQSQLSMISNLNRVASFLNKSFTELAWETLEYGHMVNLVGWMHQKGLSHQTITSTLAALHGVARQAFILKRMTAENYHLILEVKAPAGSRIPRGRALSLTELALLLDSCATDPRETTGDRDGAILALLAGAGLRRSEAVALKLSHYDPETQTLKVLGKGNKERWAYFIDRSGALRALSAWLKRRGRAPGYLLCPINKSGRVIVAERNPHTPHQEPKRLSVDALYKALHQRALSAGVAPFAPHDLRRTFVTQLLQSGADLSTVRKLMGHVKIETTAEYDKRREETKRRVLRNLKFPYRGRPRRKPRRGRRRRRH